MRKSVTSPAAIKHLLLVAGATLLLAAGCDEGTDPDPGIELPVNPQVRASVGFVVFDVVASGGTASKDVLLLNGGQEDLVFSSIEILNNPGTFSIEPEPAAMTAASRDAVTVTIVFKPNQRGVSMAQLSVKSNAENQPDLELELVGPAGSSPLPDGPDLLMFEDTVEVVPDVAVPVELEQGEINVVYLDLAFVRFVNVGKRSLAIGGYDVMPDDERFALAAGTTVPTVDDPTPLGPGAFIIVSVVYDDEVAGGTTGTFSLTTYDYQDVEYDAGERTVPPNALVTTDVSLSAE